MSIHVAYEGSTLSPAFTLQVTNGISETALLISEISNVTWSRLVVGTAEVVNGRSNVSITPIVNPFTIEQGPADNTRVDSSRVRERHLIEVDFKYVEALVTGKTGKIVAEVIVVPSTRVVYCRLEENSGYLRRITAGFESTDIVTPEDLLDAEDDARDEIEARLGKRFYSSSRTIPGIIRHIAEKLSVAHLRSMIHVGQTKETNEYASKLREEALQAIEDLLSHKMGVQYDDGTWDEDYPKPNRSSMTVKLGTRKPIVFIRELPFRKQMQREPTEADLERQGDEDRDVRKGEDR